MTVAINLTPVLVTLIICVFLYAMCKMARKTEASKAPKDFKELKVPECVNNKHNMRVVPSTQEQDLREYVEGRAQEGESKQ